MHVQMTVLALGGIQAVKGETRMKKKSYNKNTIKNWLNADTNDRTCILHSGNPGCPKRVLGIESTSYMGLKTHPDCQ